MHHLIERNRLSCISQCVHLKITKVLPCNVIIEESEEIANCSLCVITNEDASVTLNVVTLRKTIDTAKGSVNLAETVMLEPNKETCVRVEKFDGREL